MKILKDLRFYTLIALVLMYVASSVSRSNSASVTFTFQKVDSVGSDGGDLPALRKLNELVEENYLDRDYYEVFSIEDNTWHQWCTNYNKKHQALFIGGGDDGWSYFFYATPQELKMIADRKIPAYKLHQFLKPFPSEYLGEISTRSRDMFSIF